LQQRSETPAQHGGVLEHLRSVAHQGDASSPDTEIDELTCNELRCRWPVRFRLELRAAACCYALAIGIYWLPWRGHRDLSGTTAVTNLGAMNSSQSYLGMLRWSSHPNLCIDATDHQFANGTSLQLWTCSMDNTAQQLIFPLGTVGKIRWAKHPDFCLTLPHHVFQNGTLIQMWKCLPNSDAQKVLIPKEGRGMIRWISQPTKCLDVRGGSVHTAVPGARVQTWKCTEGNTNQNFHFIRKKRWQPPVTKPPETKNKSRLAWPQCSCSVGKPTGPSLFCWFIGASSGSSLDLMKNALQQKVGIFACDWFSMFSDKIVPLSADGKIVTTSLISASVGDWAWGKRLDTQVFMAAWRVVIKQAIFKEASWTVKVNAETYFCPDRLRRRLAILQDSSAGVASYLRTPVHPKDSLEVYSKKAVEVYAARSNTHCGRIHLEMYTEQDCVLPEHDCSVVGACLRRLGVVARMDHGLLLRDSCEKGRCQPLDPSECGSCKYSAFHPLMSPANYSLCHAFVQSEG